MDLFLLTAIFVFTLGLGVGSFLLVLLDRREREEQALRGRSYCEKCKKTLRWFELLPVVSFLLQGGKCRTCQARLSYQYPLVELLTGGIFLFVFLKICLSFFPNPSNLFLEDMLFSLFAPALLFGFIIASLCILIFLYDLRHKIIPNAYAYTLAILALFSLFFQTLVLGQANFFSSGFLLAFLAGPLLASPFAFLWLVSRGRWMGLGDAKLALGIGWLLGLGQGLTSVVIAFWIGAVVALFLIAGNRLSHFCGQLHWWDGKKKLTMKSELPLGPFLILGVGLAFFFGINFFTGDPTLSFIPSLTLFGW